MPPTNAIPFLGESCALAAAFCWSIATIMFRRSGEKVAPLALNLYKNVLALLLFGVTLVLARCWPTGPVSNQDRLLLLVSGGIGIGLSDVLFFITLNRVGAGLQAIITTSYSPSIIALSVIFLHERLTTVQCTGIALILTAVGIVAYDRSGHGHVARRTMTSGVVCGLLATATQAVSIVMIKRLLEQTPLVWANAWRLIGGVSVSALLFVLLPTRRRDLRPLQAPRNWLALA
ncbi:MAG: DMT family transporter, partial [Candidatus Eisenbacteria bacterium]